MTDESVNAGDDFLDVDHDPSWRAAPWRHRIRRALLAWYSKNRRDLPWRRDPTPYNVWVSEIMCQQTQVATVLPYFARFMKRFPTIKSLAEADEVELMKLWEGLGYYRRARNLQAAAKHITNQHQGHFPLDMDDVLALPGIGRYTAGAILSISDDQRHPILEGNTQRVFSRLIALKHPPMESRPNKLLWTFAGSLLPKRSGSGDLNQAMMELGALVCKPKEPNCSHCPVMRSCQARQRNLIDKIPGKVTRVRYENRDEFAFVIKSRSGYLMRPLPSGGRWAGLWDFPRSTDLAVTRLSQANAWLESELATVVKPIDRLMTIRHGVTKYKISLDVYESRLETNPRMTVLRKGRWEWIDENRMAELPLSVTGRKIAKWLARRGASPDRQRRLPLS